MHPVTSFVLRLLLDLEAAFQLLSPQFLDNS
jgi:hypothetical protein